MEKEEGPAPGIPQFDGIKIEKWRARMLSYFRKKKWFDLPDERKMTLRSTKKAASVKAATKTATTGTPAETEITETVGDEWDYKDAEAMDFIISKLQISTYT